MESCPETRPAPGSQCKSTLECTYPALGACEPTNEIIRCENGKWVSIAFRCLPLPPDYYSCPAQEPVPGNFCASNPSLCTYGAGCEATAYVCASGAWTERTRSTRTCSTGSA